MNEQPGYIYLIKAGEHYKIGKSTNVARRMQQFNLPIPIELLHTIAAQDMGRVESYLHKRFADQRVRGEWFTLSPDDIAWVCSLETLEPLPELLQTTQERMGDTDDLLSAAEAAKYLGITRARIHAIRESRQAAGQEFGQQLGKYWYFTKEELDAYDQTKQRPNPVKSADLIPTPVVRKAA